VHPRFDGGDPIFDGQLRRAFATISLNIRNFVECCGAV
jgi:hypothetical protein